MSLHITLQPCVIGLVWRPTGAIFDYKGEPSPDVLVPCDEHGNRIDVIGLDAQIAALEQKRRDMNAQASAPAPKQKLKLKAKPTIDSGIDEEPQDAEAELSELLNPKKQAAKAKKR